MFERERRNLDDGVNQVASKVKGSTLVYVLICVVIAALIWRWL